MENKRAFRRNPKTRKLLRRNFTAMDKTKLVNLTKDVYRLTLLFPKRDPLRHKIREVASDILADFVSQAQNGLPQTSQADVILSLLEVASAQDWVAKPAILKIQEQYGDFKISVAKKDIDEFRKDEAEKNKTAAAAGSGKDVIYAPAAPQPPLISPSLAKAIQPDEITFARISAEVEFVDLPPIEINVLPEESLAKNKTEESESKKEDKKDEDKDEDEGEDEDNGNKNIGKGDVAGEDESAKEKQGLTQSQTLRQNRIVDYLQEKGRAQVWEIQKIFPDISKRTIRRDFRSLLKQGLIERIGERNKTYYKLKINIS